MEHAHTPHAHLDCNLESQVSRLVAWDLRGSIRSARRMVGLVKKLPDQVFKTPSRKPGSKSPPTIPDQLRKIASRTTVNAKLVAVKQPAVRAARERNATISPEIPELRFLGPARRSCPPHAASFDARRCIVFPRRRLVSASKMGCGTLQHKMPAYLREEHTISADRVGKHPTLATAGTPCSADLDASGLVVPASPRGPSKSQ